MFQIGNLKLKNRLIMAPMAGITNSAFRLMVKKMGAGLVFTEMISATGLVLKAKKTLDYLKSTPLEKPLGVQLFGSKPDIMARAADIALESGADLIDINMGCPVKKVVKTGAGAALLKELKRIGEIVSSVRLTCPVPLTVKIRSGWSPDKPVACEAARVVETSGADALTIHPRFATQGYTGRSDWTLISRVKKTVTIPVIGNGDIVEPEDGLKMRDLTGCDGIMIGRAAARKPWIFKQVLQMEKGLPPYEPDLQELRSIIMEHYGLLSESMAEQRAAMYMRGLLLRYTKGLPLSGRFRNKFSRIKDSESLVSVMDKYFTMLEERRV